MQVSSSKLGSCLLFTISFNFILNCGIRARFLYNDMVSPMHDLPISENKKIKKCTISRISKKKYTNLKNLPIISLVIVSTSGLLQ